MRNGGTLVSIFTSPLAATELNPRRGMALSKEYSVTNGVLKRKLPTCWGHRGRMTVFPENTMVSYRGAIAIGAEGIEGDIQVSLDNVLVMRHDDNLATTTDKTGLITQSNWYGPDGIQNARTKKDNQPVPNFSDVIDLLTEPENKDIMFNVDIKPTSEPTRLFTIMREILVSYPNWETELAPRIVLGVWVAKFVKPSRTLLPQCRLSFIGVTSFVQPFWEDCSSFSLPFAFLVTWEGQRLRKRCQAAGKPVFVWAINSPHQMVEAVRWGLDVIITDDPQVWMKLRPELEADYEKVDQSYGRLFLWTNPFYYSPVLFAFRSIFMFRFWWRGFSKRVIGGGAISLK